MNNEKPLLACVVLTAVLAAQVASAQLVTNEVQITQGVGVRTTDLANPAAATYPQQFNLAVTRGYNNDPSKAWIQFDLSSAWATYGQANLASATLTLWGENGTSRSFSVFGLADSAGFEGWNMVTTYWTNAPGNNVASANGYNVGDVYGGAALWTTSPGVDLANPNFGTLLDQAARYTSPDLSTFLATDTDGLVTFTWNGSNNQNWWVGTNGLYANDMSLGYVSQQAATLGELCRQSPTLTLVFTNAPLTVAAPVFTNIMLAGTNIILQGRDGVTNGAYQMLRSPNLTAPIDNWLGLGIQTFDASGNFSFTSGIPPETSENVYRLLVLSSGPVFAPGITTQPQDIALAVGNAASFSVTATGTAPLMYRWFFNTNTLLASGPSATLNIPNTQVTNSGTISVTVSNLFGITNSVFATLTVTNSTALPSISEQPDTQSVSVGQTANFGVTAGGAMPLHYQWYYNTNTLLLDETNSTLTLVNVNTNQAGKYSVTVTNLYGSTNSAFVTLNVNQEVLAFPEAEGYGKHATGGRGGAVYEVTTLNPTGTGSFGAAISATGARTVVFRVAGTITGNFNINRDNITIAGQTAPGDGICIKGSLSVSANNAIIRYVRVRLNTATSPESDTVGTRGYQNIILDHVSASWSGDEVMSFYQNSYVTLQWCMITEACAKFIGGTNTGHQFGGIWGNNFGTYHHNLIAHNVSRNPRWASGCKYNDYRNNVIYNWDYESCYGGEAVQPGAETVWNFTAINMVANYYKYGPATDSGVRSRIANPSARSADDKGSWYVADNYVNGYPAVTANNWLGVAGSDYIPLGGPWPAMPINQQTPQDAYAAVLAHVGCSKPNRDSVDATIVNDVTTGTAAWGVNGILTYPTDAGGGWPTLATGTPPTDTDHDGMPDAWEDDHGLDRTNPADRNYYTLSPVYTNLEVYLNELGAF